ncbi:hypothetical protein F4820DRAFT_446488 [Hypoxylon rubiginosum]|uniref:Uncharacterized protein n=1 Tax=Hypoxylon rubiginosum TaxID=110542 RepID=A0ACB9Z5D5_9PEZI|nr:hypothetical protein F4820DRAFT_446488 [Hypoxylon rubiginosum]
MEDPEVQDAVRAATDASLWGLLTGTGVENSMGCFLWQWQRHRAKRITGEHERDESASTETPKVEDDRRLVSSRSSTASSRVRTMLTSNTKNQREHSVLCFGDEAAIRPVYRVARRNADYCLKQTLKLETKVVKERVNRMPSNDTRLLWQSLYPRTRTPTA